MVINTLRICIFNEDCALLPCTCVGHTNGYSIYMINWVGTAWYSMHVSKKTIGQSRYGYLKCIDWVGIILHNYFKSIHLPEINSLWTNDAIRWHSSGWTLALVMAWCLTAPSHYLNQCWLIISKVLWYSPEGKVTKNAGYDFINYKFGITAPFLGGQWV